MQLKCFGGPHDQQYQLVDNYLRQGDAWRIAEAPKFEVLDHIPTMDNITINYHIYIIERIQHCKFLRYQELSIRELLDKIFA